MISVIVIAAAAGAELIIKNGITAAAGTKPIIMNGFASAATREMIIIIATGHIYTLPKYLAGPPLYHMYP